MSNCSAWRSHIRRVVAYGLLAAIVIGSFLPPKDINAIHLPGNDKVVHASAYMLLTFAFLFSYRKAQFKKWWGVILSIWVLGAFIEIFQPIISPGRQRDFFDLLANSSGIAVAVIVMLLFRKFRYPDSVVK